MGAKKAKAEVRLENLSPKIMKSITAVLEKNGFAGHEVSGLKIKPAAPATVAPPNYCRRWRCWTRPDGTRECGWVWEPC